MALLLQGIMPGADGSLWGAWSCLVLVPCDRESCPLTFAVGAHSELLHLQFRNGAWTSWPIVGTVGGAVTMASRVVPQRCIGIGSRWAASSFHPRTQLCLV